MAQRVRSRPEGMKRRKTLVAPPFGTMKRGWDAGSFVMRGLEKVRTECSVTVLAYNLRRVLTLVEMPQLIAALRGAGSGRNGGGEPRQRAVE